MNNKMMLQEEVVTGLLSNTDATIVGILLAMTAILLFFIGMLIKKIFSDQEYIRGQDKITLEVLKELTHTLKTGMEASREVKDDIQAMTISVNEIRGDVKTVRRIIESKILEK